jgi:anti-anti-sigma regulatory factor
MTSRLGVDIQETDSVSFVTFAGVIDEDNQLSTIPTRVGQKLVVINAADIERINSCGVRDWVNMLGQLEQKGIKYYFIRCSPAIMAQVNLVNNFAGKGQILTFFAPYYCPPCDVDNMLLIETAEAQKEVPFRAPSCRCDQCDQLMEFDDIESSYFAFLGTTKNEPPEQAVTDAIKRFAGDQAERMRTRKTPNQPTLAQTPTSDSFPAQMSATAPSSKALRGFADGQSVGQQYNAYPRGG